MLDAFLDEEVGIPPTPLRASSFNAPGRISSGIDEDEDDEYHDIEWCDEPDAEQAQDQIFEEQGSQPIGKTSTLELSTSCIEMKAGTPHGEPEFQSQSESSFAGITRSASAVSSTSTGSKMRSDDQARRVSRHQASELRRRAAMQHRILSLCFVARLRSFNSICDDRLVQAIVLSLVDGEFCKGDIHVASGINVGNASRGDWRQLQKQLRRCLLRRGKILADGPALRASPPNLQRSSLIYSLLGHRTPSQEDYILLLVAACRAVGIPARIVMVLPLPSAGSCGKLLAGGALPASRLWAEVFDEGSRHWLPVFGDTCGDATAVSEPARLASAPWLLAAGEGGQLYDATRRYCKRWTTVLAARGSLARGWDAIIAGLGDGNDAGFDLEAASAAAHLLADLIDERALAKKALLEPLPASRAGFKRHRSYVLESQLRQNEVVYPTDTKPVGLFQGKEKIWRRSDVTELRTTAQWQRDGRRPRKGERAQKLLRGGSAFATSLFGVWQTEELPVVEGSASFAMDGHTRIPGLNSFGNLELLDDDSVARLPAGLVYIADDSGQKVASELRMIFAPAVVGFTRDRGGQAKPRHGGVVIWDSDEAVLRRGIAREKERLEAIAEVKCNERLLSAWQLLVKSVLVDRYVEQRYRAKS